MSKFRNVLIFIVLILGVSIAYLFAGPVASGDAGGKVHGSITDAKARVHQAQLFRTGYLFKGLASGASTGFLIDISTETFTRSQFHWTFSAIPTGKAYIRLFADPAITSSGTAVSAYSLHDSTDATGVQADFYHTPVIATTDTAISPQYVVSTGTVLNEGIFIRNQTERVGISSSSSTAILIEIINQEINGIDVGIYVDFYEVE